MVPEEARSAPWAEPVVIEAPAGGIAQLAAPCELFTHTEPAPPPMPTWSTPEPVTPWLAATPEPGPGRRRGLGAPVKAPEHVPNLALREVTGHLTRSTTGVMAWYRLRPRPWNMQGDSEREQLMTATGLALAQLAGRWVHWRVMWRPYRAAEWARRHEDWTAALHADLAHLPDWADPLPDQPGALDWVGWMVATQSMALAQQHAVKDVLIGVEVQAGRRLTGWAADRIATWGARWRGLAERASAAELTALDDEMAWLDRVIGSSALAGAPATPEDMVSLIYRSCALGLPGAAVTPTAPPGDWARTDLAGPAEAASPTATPWGPSLRVEGVAPGGQRVTRHVVIASLGRMGELDVPARDLPWMTVPDTLGAGVEWSARFRILEAERAARQLRQVADRVDAQHRHYEIDHGIAAPPVLARQIELAAQVRDELDTDHSGMSARAEGWWRLAIAADTEHAALELLERLAADYHPRIRVEHPAAQYALAREFIPGEPIKVPAHPRRMSVAYLSMAMPHADEVIGDDHGPMVFASALTGRPIPWDLWEAIDRRQVSGLTPIIGNQGAGKSFLIGALAYHALRCAPACVTLLDPSGPLTRLAELPELAGYARAVDLLDAPAGTLNPYQVVPDPIRDDYPPGPAGQAEYDRDEASAGAQRTTLVTSVLTGLLPAPIRRDGDTQAVLLDAIGQVGPDSHHDPRDVLAMLAKTGGAQGKRIAGAFKPILSAAGPARLLLGQPDGELSEWDAETDRLLVITTRGLSLPQEGTDQADWNLDEQLSLALMHLTSWLTYRRVYRLPREVPKLVGLDELRALSLLPSGRMLIQQFARDSRKFRARVLIAGQLASDVLRLAGDSGEGESGLGGLAHDVLVGRTTGDTAQAEALRLLRIPTSVGYEAQLGGLSTPPADAATDGWGAADAPREFVWRQGSLCELARLDVSGPHFAGLRQALDTNAARAARP